MNAAADKKEPLDINRILAKNPVNARHGAPMGQRNFFDSPEDTPLYLQRIRFVDGDYSTDGTYWGGGGGPLWCAFNGDDEEYQAGYGVRVFVRARTREEAVAEVRDLYPEAKFHKE